MTPPNKHYLTLGCLAIFIFFAIASGVPKNASYSDAAEWIPKDFNPTSTTLLIEKHPLKTKQNDRMIKYLQDHYPYPFEVVSKDDINNKNGKYADLKKYRFALLWRPSVHTYTTFSNGVSSEHRAWDMFGNFIDRSTNKSYPSTSGRNIYGDVGYKPVINSIIKLFKK